MHCQNLCGLHSARMLSKYDFVLIYFENMALKVKSRGHLGNPGSAGIDDWNDLSLCWEFFSGCFVNGDGCWSNWQMTKYTHIRDHPLLETSLFFTMSYCTFLAAEAAGMTGKWQSMSLFALVAMLLYKKHLYLFVHFYIFTVSPVCVCEVFCLIIHVDRAWTNCYF